MFLLPALGAGSSDALILYLQWGVDLIHSPYDDESHHDEDSDGGLDPSAGDDNASTDDDEVKLGNINIQSTQYLTVLAVVRLLLLALPLSYHTYTWTRIKFPFLYYILHGASIMVVLGHMLSIMVLDPDSIGSLMPSPVYSIAGGGSAASLGGSGGEVYSLGTGSAPQLDDTGSSGIRASYKGPAWLNGDVMDKYHRFLYDIPYPDTDPSGAHTLPTPHAAAMRHVWVILGLSLFSIALHMLIMLHVKSSAPNSVTLNEKRRDKRKRRMLAYYAYSRYGGGRSRTVGGNVAQGRVAGENAPTEIAVNGTATHAAAVKGADGSLIDISPDPLNGVGDNGASSLLLPHHQVDGEEKKEDRWRLPSNGSFRNLTGYDEFMSEVQSRVDDAKQMWSDRLDDVTRKIESQIQNNPNLPLPSTRASLSFLNAKSPFRVLLQLFAYEEVLSNGRLDAVFKMDNGVAITFYVPQLLSFLLHGAFTNSPQLERWVLGKCKENVHFAHRCFWFLRAWCLGGGAHKCRPQRSSSDPRLGDEESSIMSSALHGSEANLYRAHRRNSSNVYHSDDEKVSSSLQRSNSWNRRRADLSGFHDDSIQSEGDDFQRKSSKFPPEEHALIESLLQKVIECGELPAHTLQYGPNDSLEVGVEQGVLIAADGAGETGRRKGSYMEVPNDDDFCDITPGDFSPSLLASKLEGGLIPVDPGTGFPSTSHLDSFTARHKFGFLPTDSAAQGTDALVQSRSSLSENKLFLSTPRFLDALTAIADDLMLVPRSKRTEELRHRLRSLECELLPSNVVYLPIQSMHHRVWRIAADESIALSTKERVPCIVALEVIDYKTEVTAETRSKKSSPTMEEMKVLSTWVKNERPPQRHKTVFDRVSKRLSVGLRKLEESIMNDEHNRNWTNLMALTSSVHRGGSVDDEREDVEANHRATELTNSSAPKNPLDEDLLSLVPPPPFSEPQTFTPEQISEKFSSKAPRSSPPRPPLPADALKALSSPASSLPPLTPTSQPSSRNSSRPPSPVTAMGQWGSPIPTPMGGKKKPLIRRRTSDGKKSTELDEYHYGSTHLAENGLQVRMGDDESSAASDSMEIATEAAHKSNTSPDRTSVSKQPRKVKAVKKQRPQIIFVEDWATKEERLRKKSVYGQHPCWRLLPVLIKSNDDLRQEQLAAQLIQRMATILARASVPVWLYPYEILALSDRGGIIECVPDTISLDSLKRNDPNYLDLSTFFAQHFGEPGSDEHAGAKANFVESLAAYSIVCYLMQIKDRHNGNILLDNKGHLVHIDFGFFFLSSPGKNSGFESAPFKLTRDFVDLMDGPDSRTFVRFRDLCFKTFLELRKNCYQITLLVEMLMEGNEDLGCFRGRPHDAVQGLKQRFRLDLNDNGIREYVNSLVNESLENWRTRWYDRYQRFCVGVL